MSNKCVEMIVESEMVRTVKDSQVEMTEIVLPNDTNQLGNMLGGRLMHLIDIAAAIAAARHTNRVCVTASIDELNFLEPIRLGQIVILQASVNRAFRTSVEVGVKVIAEDVLTGKRKHANTAYLTFVAIDESGKPVPVRSIQPITEEEKRRYKDAEKRRDLRLMHRKRLQKS